MERQIIVTIGREHGSGGHYIGKIVAGLLDIGFYDREIVEGITQMSGYSPDIVAKMDEKPINFFTSRRIGEYSNSLEENVAEKTFEFIRCLAAGGKSFVVVGRCAEHVLKGNPNVFRLFICGEQEAKVKRIMEVDGVSAVKAFELIRNIDRRRKAYHNYYCDCKWGDSRGYDMTVNSSKMGPEATAEVLVRCIRAFGEK